MNPLTFWREELRRLIPRGFVRRDQGDGLLISDYPRWGEAEKVTAALLRAGYTARLDKGLAYLDGTPEKYRALAMDLSDACPVPTDETLMLYSLAQRLMRTGGDITEENLSLMRLTVKCLDGGDWPALNRLLPPACAEAQRKHIPLPKAGGQMIMQALSER